MSYCPNCGAQLVKGSRFCAECGIKINTDISKSNDQTAKSKMEKGAVKSLQEEISESVQSKISDSVKPNIKNDPVSEMSEQPVRTKPYRLAKKLMIYYVLFNIPVYALNQGDNELLGILIFTTVILINFMIFMFKKKKNKPFNWLLKILLLLQILLIISYLTGNFENMGNSLASSVALISLPLLMIVNLILIFKGNKE